MILIGNYQSLHFWFVKSSHSHIEGIRRYRDITSGRPGESHATRYACQKLMPYWMCSRTRDSQRNGSCPVRLRPSGGGTAKLSVVLHKAITMLVHISISIGDWSFPLVTKALRLGATMVLERRGRLCPNGKRREAIEIGGPACASRRLCRPSFHRLFCLGRSPARLCRQHRGLRSTLIGAPIQFAPIA